MAAKSTSASRGPLTSMRNRHETRDFVLDQLSGVRNIRAQSMFGGIGVYADEVFFAILAADVLYFKVDDTTRSAYEAAGSAPFKPYEHRPMTMPYFAVPVHVLESASTLVEWANRSIAVAKASRRSPGKTAKAVTSKAQRPRARAGFKAAATSGTPVGKNGRKNGRKTAWKTTRKAAREAARKTTGRTTR